MITSRQTHRDHRTIPRGVRRKNPRDQQNVHPRSGFRHGVRRLPHGGSRGESRGDACARKCGLGNDGRELWRHEAWQQRDNCEEESMDEKVSLQHVEGCDNLRNFDGNVNGIWDFNFFNDWNLDFLVHRKLLGMMVMNCVNFIGNFDLNSFAVSLRKEFR